MHVLHVIEATIGGTRRHVVDACRGLAARGVRTTLVCAALREPAFRGDMATLAAAGVEVRELPMVRAPRPATDLRHLFALRALLRELRPDIVHTHSSKAGVLGRSASALCGIGARVHTPHTFAFLFGAMFSSSARALYRGIEQQLARRTDRFIAVSDDEARTFTEAGFVPANKLRVVPNGIDPRPWSAAQALPRAELGVPEAAPLAALVGLLNVAKGQDLAIRALAEPGLEALHLCIAGVGECEGEYRRLARELGLESRVHLLGWRDDVPRLLAAADLLVLPSRWEGMPYIVLEAMAAARPVVAARVDGARALIEGGRCGMLCEVESAPALAESLRRALALAPKERRQLGLRGRAAVESRYTLEHMLDGLQAVYAELA